MKKNGFMVVECIIASVVVLTAITILYSQIKGVNGSCVDGNNNTVCQVYKITLSNSGSSSVMVNGHVVLDKKNNPNLKWAILNNTESDVLTNPVLNGSVKTPEETDLVKNDLYHNDYSR